VTTLMLGLALRRLRAQRRMVAAVVVLVATATTQLGVATLLLGPTQERAFAVAVQRSQPQQVEVTAYLVDLAGADLTSAQAEASEVVDGVLGSMDATLSTFASSRVRDFAAGDGVAYLATTDALDQRAQLTSGRWPGAADSRGVLEAVVPDNVASRLNLALGDRLRLDGEAGLGGVDNVVRVVVVGTFRPRARSGWDGDRLSGAGFDPAFSDGTKPAPTYGPFLVDGSSFLASGSAVSGLRVTGRPDLDLADDAALRSAVTALRSASALLSSRVGDRVRITRVASELPVTYDGLRAEQSAARSTVLVVLLLGTAMSLAALLLAGRLVAGVRDDERALLVALGLARGQQVRTALLEGAMIAVTATVLAVPAAAAAHAWLTHLPAMRAADVTQGATVSWALVSTGLVGALVMTLALALPALDLAPTAAAGRWRVTVRSGVDLLVVVAVGAAWWQLGDQQATVATGADVALIVAPVVFVLGLVLLLARCLPFAIRLVARAALRSRALVLPLAAVQAARRPESVAATVLLATATAASTFGIALQATWERSQHDQADLRVGTDLTLALSAPAGPEEAADVIAAVSGTGGPVVSAVAVRPLALGRYLGERGSPPVLVALDSRKAGALLRGRLDGQGTWARVGAGLRAGGDVLGLPLPKGLAGTDLVGTVGGAVPDEDGISATPTAVVQDAAGFRSSVSADPIPLDGRRHRVRWQSESGRGHLVALRLQLDQASGDDPGRDETADVSIDLRLPAADAGATADGGAEWAVRPLGLHSPVRGAEVSVEPSTDGTVLHTSGELELIYLAYTGADLLATGFSAGSVVPAAVSQRLADAVGVEVGGSISATVGQTVLGLRVTAVLPDVPSAPGRIAVLADLDMLSRALIHEGRLDPVVDGWWVARPRAETVRALRGLDLGDVTTREEVGDELARGPMRVTVPATLLVLVVTAALLLLAGAVLVVSGDRRRRADEVARLRALGLTRREVRRLLRAEHGALLLPLVLVGAVAGVTAGVVIGPGLVRSDLGVAPVPVVVVVWPWAAELALVGGLLLTCLLVVAVVTAMRVRRSDPASLRTDAS
jgi:hypothetical protein